MKINIQNFSNGQGTYILSPLTIFFFYKYGTLVKTLTSPSTTSTATVNLPTWEADESGIILISIKSETHVSDIDH